MIPGATKGQVLEHLIAARADAIRYQEAGSPTLARIRRNDEAALRSYLRGMTEGGTR